MPIREIATILTAKDEASGSLAAVSATGDDTANSMESVESSTDGANESLLALDAKAAAAGGSVAALGTAMQSTLDSTQDTRAQLARVATTMEMTDDEAITLAAGMTDASLSTRQAAATMEALAQAGVESEEQLRETTLAIDAIADATGSTSDQIDEGIIQTLRATGNEVDDVGEKMDTFSFVANDTTVELNDFQRMVSSAGGDLEEMGADVEDTAAIMAALDDQGVRTRDVLRDFRSAAGDDTVDSVEDLHDEMGLSAEEFEEYRTAVDDAEGATEEYQDRANDTFSVMDELRAATSRAQLRFAGFNDTLSIAAPTLQAAGSAGLFFATVNTSALIPSLKAKTGALVASSTASLASVKATLAAASAKGVLAGAGFTAAGAITALWASTGPLGLALLGLSAGVLGLVGVLKTDLFGAGEQAEAILGRLGGAAGTTTAIIRELLGIGKELGRITLTAGALGLIAPFAAVLKFFEDPQRWIEAGREVPSMVASGIHDAAGEPVAAVTDMAGGVRDRLPFSPAKTGPLASIDSAGEGMISPIVSDLEAEGPRLVNTAENVLAATPLGMAASGASDAVGIAGSGEAGSSSGDTFDVTVNNDVMIQTDDLGENPQATGRAVASTTVDELMRKLARESSR